MADTVVTQQKVQTGAPKDGVEGENAFAQLLRALIEMFKPNGFATESAAPGGNPAVKKLQGELADQGFYPKTGKLAQDGIAGDVTRHALRLRDEPGYAAEHMKTALQGDKLSKTEIMKIQASLNKLGYDVGDVNGRMNNETRDDLKRFLKDNPSVKASNGILDESAPKTGLGRIASDIGEKFRSGKDYVFTPSAGGATGRLKDLISQHESGGNYNARYGKSGGDGTDFTNMTINEVQKWQRDFVNNGSKSSAVGRYQIIQTTMASLKDEMGLTGNEKFDAKMQDRMAEVLLERRGLKEFVAGKISADKFMDNVSKEWASMPNRHGRGHYDGDGLNAVAKGITNDVKSAINGIKEPQAAPTVVVAAAKPNDVDFSRPVTPTGKGLEGVAPVGNVFARAANDAPTNPSVASNDAKFDQLKVSNGAPVMALT